MQLKRKAKLPTVTCICCNVLEHIITSITMSYLDQNNIRFQNQHGFRRKVSCETQLIQFTQGLYDTLNQWGQTDITVMDFSKAFDKVDHQRLLLKLHQLGINRAVIAWIKLFLTVNRLGPAHYCLVCRRAPFLDPACFSCILKTCQSQSKTTPGCLPTTPLCT